MLSLKYKKQRNLLSGLLLLISLPFASQCGTYIGNPDREVSDGGEGTNKSKASDDEQFIDSAAQSPTEQGSVQREGAKDELDSASDHLEPSDSRQTPAPRYEKKIPASDDEGADKLGFSFDFSSSIALPLRVESSSFLQVKAAMEASTRAPLESLYLEDLIDYFAEYDDKSKPDAGEVLAISHELDKLMWSQDSYLLKIAMRRVGQGQLEEAPGLADLSAYIDFNPQRVAAYRLLGYDGPAKNAEEVLQLAKVPEDFSKTVVFEVKFIAQGSGNIFNLKANYVNQKAQQSQSLSYEGTYPLESTSLASERVRFMNAVVTYGLFIKGQITGPSVSFSSIANLFVGFNAISLNAKRQEFLSLVELSERLSKSP